MDSSSPGGTTSTSQRSATPPNDRTPDTAPRISSLALACVAGHGSRCPPYRRGPVGGAVPGMARVGRSLSRQVRSGPSVACWREQAPKRRAMRPARCVVVQDAGGPPDDPRCGGTALGAAGVLHPSYLRATTHTCRPPPARAAVPTSRRHRHRPRHQRRHRRRRLCRADGRRGRRRCRATGMNQLDGQARGDAPRGVDCHQAVWVGRALSAEVPHTTIWFHLRIRRWVVAQNDRNGPEALGRSCRRAVQL